MFRPKRFSSSELGQHHSQPSLQGSARNPSKGSSVFRALYVAAEAATHKDYLQTALFALPRTSIAVAIRP